MPYRLACADFTFPLLHHDRALQLIALLDLAGVDVGLFENRSHLWPSREFTDVAAASRRLRQRLDDLGLQAADIFLQMDADFRPYAINHPQAARRQHARDWFQRTLDYAAGCGSRHVTILPGLHFEGESAADSLARAVEELNWRLEQAAPYAIVCSVEAHVGSIVPDPASTRALLERVPGLTLTLDYTHFTRAGFADAEIEPLVASASHFHVRGARPGRLQTGFHQSQIDYARVVQALQESGYQGWLGLEYVWQDWEHCNESDTVAETILYRDFLRAQPQLAGPH